MEESGLGAEPLRTYMEIIPFILAINLCGLLAVNIVTKGSNKLE